jgi:hypothetical protein
MQINDKVYTYKFIYDEHGKIKKSKKTNTIIGISKYFICIDDDLFTKLVGENQCFKNCYSYLDKVSVFEDQLLPSSPKEIKCCLTSTSNSDKINETRMKKELKKFIKNKMWYIDNIDKILKEINFTGVKHE